MTVSSGAKVLTLLLPVVKAERRGEGSGRVEGRLDGTSCVSFLDFLTAFKGLTVGKGGLEESLSSFFDFRPAWRGPTTGSGDPSAV